MVICRIILCIFLTSIVQLIAIFVFVESQPAGLITALVVSLMITLIFFVVAWRQYAQMLAYRERATMAKNPDRFDPGKVDCYVRFIGKVQTENTATLPFSKKECAFYAANMVAEWTTKKKKPERGLETHRKTLLRTHSADEFELVGTKERVYITMVR